MNLSAPIRNPDAISAFEQLDARLRDWTFKFESEERQFPMLIDGVTIRKAEYSDAFPHLLMSASVAARVEAPLDDKNVRLTEWFLSPAVCYHALAELAGHVLEREVVITARGHCFRNEASNELVPGRRQVEFQMRELVFMGTESRLNERLAMCQTEVAELAETLGLESTWCPACDPFFLPRARGKAVLQRMFGTKFELCLSCGLAIASINRHGTFLAERFGISLSDGSPAHTACVAFGLDRWVAHVSAASL
jgi:hypothetical protein